VETIERAVAFMSGQPSGVKLAVSELTQDGPAEIPVDPPAVEADSLAGANTEGKSDIRQTAWLMPVAMFAVRHRVLQRRKSSLTGQPLSDPAPKSLRRRNADLPRWLRDPESQ
jgi:hypothetical protein